MSEHDNLEEAKPRSNLGPLQDIIDELIEYVDGAKTMPLSNNALIDRDYVLTSLTRLRAELPDELRAARWMVREREAFIARTNEKAGEIVDKAKAESRRLVSESHILAEAVEEANILVKRAEGEARMIRLKAEDDLERSLEQVENLMAELLRKTHNARDELHQARPPVAEVPL